ncbi:MAG TPA: MATE family efflux transporter [Kofleriaceae bacterium]
MSGEAGGRGSRAAILEAPLVPTLLTMWWPLALTSLVGEAQGFISMFWIGRLIGESGLATLAVMSPVLTTLAFISGTFPVGVQVLAAQSMGRQDGEAIPVIVNGGYMGAVFGAMIAFTGAVFLWPIARMLAGDLGIAQSLQSYLLPWSLGYIVPVVGGVAMFAVGATGWTRFGLFQSIVSIGFMIVLMPIFVRFLHLGLTGVALSDVSSDIMLFVLTSWALYKFRNELELGPWRREHWRLDFRWWKKILAIGVPFQAARAMDSVAQIVLVRVLMETGQKAVVAGYGIAMFVMMLVMSFFCAIGVAAGIIIGQNVGAKNLARANATLRLTVLWIAGVAVVLVVLATFATPIFWVFTDSEAVVAQAGATIGALKWAMPAGMLSAILLRSFTAVSPNKLGNALSILCALVSIGIAIVWPGTAFHRIVAAILIPAYLRLALLALVFPRYFSGAIRRRSDG